MSKEKCIFISAHLPSPYIPVAGQKIAYQNLEELNKEFDVILITFVNKMEKKYFDSTIYNSCYKYHFFNINLVDRITSCLLNLFKPFRVTPRYKKEIVNLIEIYKRDYSIKVFHSEYTAAMSYEKHFEIETQTEVVEHDIVYQSLERLSKSDNFFKNLFYTWEGKKQKLWELNTLNCFNKIIVLNEKDKTLLKKENKNFNIEIAFPKIDEWCYKVKRDIFKKHTILFLGAMHRFENQDAIKWFIKEVFPTIKKEYSDSIVYIVGGNPPIDIQKLSNESIIVTGFVNSLKYYFEKSQVAIVPLNFGAGIKIKTLETLAARIPTIATDIGAEGIPSNKNLIIANNKEEFIQKIKGVFEE